MPPAAKPNKKGEKSAQQIPMFKNQRDLNKNRDTRSDSNISDLNQVLQQNLKINEVNFDADGNINDHRGAGNREDEDDAEYYAGDQNGKDINKFKSNIQRYFKASEKLFEKK